MGSFSIARGRVNYPFTILKIFFLKVPEKGKGSAKSKQMFLKVSYTLDNALQIHAQQDFPVFTHSGYIKWSQTGDSLAKTSSYLEMPFCKICQPERWWLAWQDLCLNNNRLQSEYKSSRSKSSTLCSIPLDFFLLFCDTLCAIDFAQNYTALLFNSTINVPRILEQWFQNGELTHTRRLHKCRRIYTLNQESPNMVPIGAMAPVTTFLLDQPQKI